MHADSDPSTLCPQVHNDSGNAANATKALSGINRQAHLGVIADFCGEGAPHWRHHLQVFLCHEVRCTSLHQH